MHQLAVGAVCAAMLSLPTFACAQEADDEVPGRRQGQAAQPEADQATTSLETTDNEEIPGLRGLDNVVIGVNDPEGAAKAYERLGFNFLSTARTGPGEPTGFIAFPNGYLEFVGPGLDSLGAAEPYTFEGAVAQGWEVKPLEGAVDALGKRGARFSVPLPGAVDAAPGEEPADDAAADARLRRSSPEMQPVTGTSVYFVDYERGAGSWVEDFARRSDLSAPTQHPNGARRLSYVTVAVGHLEKAVKVLRNWGLQPLAPVKDERGAMTVEIPLPKGTVYLTTPLGGGGINDFLEERRAHAPEIAGKLYEGSIMAVGIEVDDLDETAEFLDQRGIGHIPMHLPSGTVEVVQGAPGWALRLEFVQAGSKPNPAT